MATFISESKHAITNQHLWPNVDQPGKYIITTNKQPGNWFPIILMKFHVNQNALS